MKTMEGMMANVMNTIMGTHIMMGGMKTMEAMNMNRTEA